MSSPKIALVTGASSGFGQLTASSLADRGYRVFGTSRRAHSTPSKGIGMLVLDVRSNDSVRSCVEQLMGQVDRIDVLVNNAGQIHASVVEETSLEQAQDILDTNFWGAVRVTNAVLPIMRRQRHGHIINVSSLAGLIGIPGQAFYSASKFALEGYTEALRLEVSPLNIHVSLTEAGFLKTPMMSKRQVSAVQLNEYNPSRQRAFNAIREHEQKAPGPESVSETILRIIGSKKPQLRYVIGRQAKFATSLQRFLPEAAYEWGKRTTFRLDK